MLEALRIVFTAVSWDIYNYFRIRGGTLEKARMRLCAVALIVGCALTVPAAGQTRVDVEPIRPSDASGTCAYKPNGVEKNYLNNVSKGETVNGPAGDPYSIHGKAGKYIAWFGIVRGITPPAQPGGYVQLLVEHRYFDGSSDCRMMEVSQSGGGDFAGMLRVDPAMIPPLALVRIYGVVIRDKDHVPQVLGQYMRVWPWHTFTFMQYGPADQSNPRWAKLANAGGGGPIYNSSPTEDYYRRVLGDPLAFGLNLKAE
jgi:hypothetical protein